jgi:glycosyltransferase involved in cell wall biosynthesis
MFVDQRWLDYLPALFPHTVVRDPGCNVAYWNLHERPLSRSDEGVRAGGAPLRFFHFSGFDPDLPYLLSRHQGVRPRVLLSEQPVLRQLCDAYAARLRAHGHGGPASPYGNSTLPDGTPIDAPMRRLFRSALVEAERLGAPLPPWPCGWDDVLQWFNSPAPEAPRLSRYLFGLYQQRPDIQREFPRPYGAQAEAYLHWARFDPLANQTIPASLRPGAPAGPGHPPSHGGGTARTPGLNVVGYFNAELGVGEVARLVTRAAKGGGIPVATLTNGQTLSRQGDGFLEGASGGPYEVTLVCANADETPRVLDGLPHRMTAGGHRVGFWFWETEELPKRYQFAADDLDEVWTATDFVAEAIRRTVAKPVYVCPLPLRLPEEVVLPRAELGLPDGFLFLFVFDFLSSIERKNPIGLIEAFGRAFRPGEGPTLVLKSINGPLAPGALEAVRTAGGGRPDVIVRDAYLPARERDALMNACDCYVSLHRAEGFGLTLAEAMALGKPTIATGYSGNLAFMSPENSFLVSCPPGRVPPGCEPYPQGDTWGEPDLDEAAALMRFVFLNPLLAQERGRRARADVVEQFSPERTVAFIRERLAALSAEGAGDTARGPASPRPEIRSETGPVALPATPPETAPAAASPEPAPEPDPFAEQLERALRSVAEAEQMLTGGIPFRTPSRFGWPGQVLRTAVLRLMRPYAHFVNRAHRHHFQATNLVLESLRGVASASSEQRAPASPDRRKGAPDRRKGAPD